jgi:hypothetical protein
MIQLNNNILYIIFITQLIDFVMIIISYFYYKNPFLNRFVSNLTILSGLLTSVGVVLTYLLFSTSYQTNINMFTLQSTDRGLINIYNSFNDNYEKCPNFIESLDFKFNTNNKSIYHSSNENSIAMDTISVKIFQSIEDYLVTATLSSTSNVEWLCRFLSYCGSDQLKEMWAKKKYIVGKKARMYIDNLFKIIEENTFNNAQEVIDFCNKYMYNDEYKKIMVQ